MNLVALVRVGGGSGSKRNTRLAEARTKTLNNYVVHFLVLGRDASLQRQCDKTSPDFTIPHPNRRKKN